MTYLPYCAYVTFFYVFIKSSESHATFASEFYYRVNLIIGYKRVIGCESDWFQARNKEIRDELQENIDRKISVDDFSQYAPMVATYGLNPCGVKSKHGYGDFP